MQTKLTGSLKIKGAGLLMILTLGVAAIQCGCDSQNIQRTGFLSDYSKLKRYSDTSFRYIPPESTIRRYSKFIIDPVEVHFHTGSTAIKERTKGRLSEYDVRDLRSYMHNAVKKALSERYNIVYQPGPGVIRISIALTDLKKSKIMQNIVPGTKLFGTGLGGASLEAEFVDTQTGLQVAAIVESQPGNRFSLDGTSTWGDAKAVMDDWSQRIRRRLDQAHGY